MKYFIRWSFTLTALLALLVVSAFAQGESSERITKLKAELDSQIRTEITKTVGGQFSFETKVVKGAPYSATAEAETIQMLTDGNRIRNKTTTTVYRDSEGRTRKEMAGKMPGAPAQIFINDPVSGTNYSLNPQQRVATKQPGGQIRLTTGTVSANGGPITIRAEEFKTELTDEAKRVIVEQKMRLDKETAEAKDLAEVVARGKMTAATGGVMVAKKAGTQESLGQQMIEGVLCEGKRTTLTIAADTIGNDLPINIVSEEWYSPELQVLVLTKRSDPRSGETIYRLTNINRTEPARALFELPTDYTVQDSFKPVMLKRTKEEQ